MNFLDYVLKRNNKGKNLDKQEIEKTNIIRLSYIALEKFRADTALGVTSIQSSPFILPEGMTNDEACKVVSYLSELVEKEDGIEEASKQSVGLVSKILTDYGFTKIPLQPHGYSHAVYDLRELGASRFSKIDISDFYNDSMKGVTDLFTVAGDFKLFEMTSLYNKYFNWFTENVSKQEIEKIYSRINKELPTGEFDASMYM